MWNLSPDVVVGDPGLLQSPILLSLCHACEKYDIDVIIDGKGDDNNNTGVFGGDICTRRCLNVSV